MENGDVAREKIIKYIPSQDWGWSDILNITLNRSIGFEKQVSLRRKTTAIAENICQNSKGFIRFETGSRADGFTMIGSDYDYMLVRTDFIVLPSFEKYANINVLRMDSRLAPPGYTYLEMKDLSNLNDLGKSLFKTIDGKHYLDSAMYRRFSTDPSGVKEPYEHGPCWSYKTDIAEYDNASCIYCKHFPSEAYEWTQRIRFWPSEETIKDIIEMGCILAPLASRVANQHEELEWRISFVLGERKLVHSLSHVHFLCYGLLKLFLKHAINKHEKLRDLLCSYFLKTILFYALENDPKIHQANVFVSFQICLYNLILCVEKGNCPNYFIPANNMFINRVYGESQKLLLELLLKLQKGPECLYEIPDVAIYYLFFKTGINKSNDETIDYPDRLHEEFLCDKEVAISGMISGGGISMKMDMYSKAIKLYNNCKTIDLTWFLLRSFISYLNQDAGDGMMQWLIPQCASNKKRYLAMRIVEEFFYACIVSDAARGWLIFATYFYKIGHLNNAIVIAEMVLERFHDYTVIHGNIPGGSIAKQAKIYMDKVCGYKFPIYRKIMTVWALDVTFEKDSTLVPEELKEICESSSPSLMIPPKFYAHLLLFLCYNLKSIQTKKIEHLQSLKVVALDDNHVAYGYKELVQKIIQICENLI